MQIKPTTNRDNKQDRHEEAVSREDKAGNHYEGIKPKWIRNRALNRTFGGPEFGKSITRDHYFKVHVEKPEISRTGGMLKPKFDLIEKKIIVPVYGVKGGIPSDESERAKLIKL